MNRLQKLEEILEIAVKHNNPDMARNVREHIELEKQNPSNETYPDPTDD